MKTLKQIREEYDNAYVNQDTPDEIMLEGNTGTTKVPGPAKMPTILVFRRVSYKLYPGKQTVALYYSKLLDKYLSIPFGPTGNVNLSEAQILDTLPEIVEEKNELPELKEHFMSKLHERRMQQVNEYSASQAADDVTDLVVPYKSAYKDYKKGNYGQAALGAALDTAGLAAGALSGGAGYAATSAIKAGLKGGVKAAGKMVGKSLGKDAVEKGAEKAVARDATAMAKSSKAPKPAEAPKVAETPKPVEAPKPAAPAAKPTLASRLKKGVGGFAAAAGGALAKSAADALLGGQDQKPEKDHVDFQHAKDQAKTHSSFDYKKDDPIYKARYKQAAIAPVKENKIIDIRKMIDENVESIDLPINGREIKLNTSMAKRILEVYDSVNVKNKKIVEGMLNEDLESFKRLLNFSIRK